MRRIKDFFGDVPIHQITSEDCQGFKKTLTEEWHKRAWAKADGKKPEVRLSTVDRYIGALKRLFNWALDMEKIEAGRMEFQRQRVEVMPLIRQVIANNTGYGDQFGVRFVITETIEDACVEGDSDRLIQVLTNLLANAAKVSPSRAVQFCRHEGGRYRDTSLSGDFWS